MTEFCRSRFMYLVVEMEYIQFRALMFSLHFIKTSAAKHYPPINGLAESLKATCPRPG
jgi:hypothetical protein